LSSSHNFVVIVVFYPDRAKLIELCNVVGRDAQVIIVDNTPDELRPLDLPDVCWISMGGNMGIAAAQNAGIRAAIDLGAQTVAFFDQDSVPESQLLPTLVAALGFPPQGVAAPICVDARTGDEYPPFRFNKWGWAEPVHVARSAENVPVDLIISSGSVVAADVFNKTGLMDEDFFIDYVDLEWCIRCRIVGIPITVVSSVTMHHAIGNDVIKYGSVTTYVHSPVRAYYRLRNAFMLLRKRHVPLLYACHEIAAALVHHILQLRPSQNRAEHLRFGLRALADGMIGVRGKLKGSV
jgi:rhamnosyltransferase